MVLSESLTQGSFEKTEQQLITKALLELYVGVEASELVTQAKRLYMQQLVPRLAPDFLLKKPEGPIRSIVEVGCGTGILSNYLSMMLPNTLIVGIDSDPDKILEAKTTVGNRGNIHFYCGDTFRLSGFKCDRLILTQQFEQMRDHSKYRRLLASTLNWLTDSGDLYIRQENPSSVFNRQFWSKLFSKDENSLILNEWLNNTLLGSGYPVVEDCLKGVRANPVLEPYLYLRAPRNGLLQFDAFARLQKARHQAREISQQMSAGPTVRPKASGPRPVRNESIDDALNVIFKEAPKENFHSFL